VSLLNWLVTIDVAEAVEVAAVADDRGHDRHVADEMIDEMNAEEGASVVVAVAAAVVDHIVHNGHF